MQTPIILLPEKIYILRDRKNQSVKTCREEYNIYFKNIIFPYSDLYDVQTDCEYGKNLGNCYRIDDFPNVDEFCLTLRIFDNVNGELLCEKKSRVIISAPKQSENNFSLLPIGDSMTQSEIYLEHLALKLKNIEFLGTRSFNGHIYHEGRGGWSSSTYMEKTGDRYGMSPFLFPKNIAAEDYFGELGFMENAGLEDSPDTYVFDGFKSDVPGKRIYLKDGKLMRNTDNTAEISDTSPQFEFSFGKYLKRYNIKSPSAVSILLGCNDLTSKTYSNYVPTLNSLIENLNIFISSIKQASPNTKILLMTPIFGGEQYSWGLSLKCKGSSAMYRHIISKTIERYLKEFEGREEENIFIVPSHMVIDPIYGYKNEYRRVNIYSEHSEFVNTDGIHPNICGYKQIGDSLAGVIEGIREL